MAVFTLLALMALTVFSIITTHRFQFERRLRAKYNIDRDWYVPVLALLIGIATSIVTLTHITTAIIEKIDIIFFIFSFAFLAAGLNDSNVFKYIAYTIAAKYAENTTKLILTTYTITSLITFFTTNDIVILVLTPIIIEICIISNVSNAKHILLSQFIAANTLSMGLLIGSPTNIIISETININFYEYATLMIPPALIAFTASFILILALTLVANHTPFLSSLSFSSEDATDIYKTQRPQFTKQMRNWIILFTLFLILTSIVTLYQASLLFCSLPAILISLAYWNKSPTHQASIKKPLKNLPYGVFFFGLTFFTFAETFTTLPTTTEAIIPYIQTQYTNTPTHAIAKTLATAGITVNIFNDLPAAAIISNTFQALELSNKIQTIAIQATLAGLNIGAYLTQVGALAGIIWFNQLRVEKNRYEHTLTTPTRTDLIKYGALHFIFTGTILTLFFTTLYLL